jgi:3-methyladenine DNA glycosylase/8-oxoguanine DNA glycosylase
LSALAAAVAAASWRPWRAYAVIHLWIAEGQRLTDKAGTRRAQVRSKSRKTPTKKISHADRSAA